MVVVANGPRQPYAAAGIVGNAMRIFFFIIALLSLAYWGVSAFDMWATLSGWPPYANYFSAELLAWMQGFPLWRKALWGAAIGFGLLGSLLMLGRARLAGPALALAWLLLTGGFAYDFAMLDAASMYGRDGVIAAAVMIVLAALFAWAGYGAARRKAVASPPPKAEPAPAPPPAAAVAPPPSPPPPPPETPPPPAAVAPAPEPAPEAPPEPESPAPAAVAEEPAQPATPAPEPEPAPSQEAPSAQEPGEGGAAPDEKPA
jgi:hypothetical protein